jgi:hypothetical protein
MKGRLSSVVYPERCVCRQSPSHHIQLNSLTLVEAKSLTERLALASEEVPIAPNVRLTCHSRGRLGESSHERMVKPLGSSYSTARSDRETQSD